MTIKEIAELCGVDRTTVLRWIQKLDPGHFAQGLAEKAESLNDILSLRNKTTVLRWMQKVCLENRGIV